MDLANVGLKDYLVIGSLSGLLRTTSMQIAGYKQRDLTYFQSYGTWASASLVAIVVYTIALRLLRRAALREGRTK